MCSWLQAVSSVLLVLVTGATLYVLYGYAKDTKRIADDSATQVERSQMPFLAAASEEPDGWFLENQGFGPALNVHYSSYVTGNLVMRPIQPLGPQRRRNLHNEIVAALGRGELRLGYESLSGKRYRTSVVQRDGAWQTDFRKLPG
jgi:hypothetical protein